MPPSIDVLTSSSAPAWPTALMPLKIPLPSPNVMVPKQSFEPRRSVLPSVAYSMAYSFLVSPKFPWREGVGRWHGRLPSLEPLHTLTSATGDGDPAFEANPGDDLRGRRRCGVQGLLFGVRALSQYRLHCVPLKLTHERALAHELMKLTHERALAHELNKKSHPAAAFQNASNPAFVWRFACAGSRAMKSIVVSAIALIIADTNDGGWRLIAPPAAHSRIMASNSPNASPTSFLLSSVMRSDTANCLIALRFKGCAEPQPMKRSQTWRFRSMRLLPAG